MGEKVKQLNIILLALLGLTGCISPTPFNQGTSVANNPDNSRLTINSVSVPNLGNMFKGGPAPGSVYIDGVYKGDFSSQQPVFSEELAPGGHTLEICQPTIYNKKDRCGIVKFNISPQTHIFYEYFYNGYSYNLYSTKQERYGASTQSVPPPPSLNAPQNSKSDLNQKGLSSLEDARKKCIELGLKPGTESFGNCVMKIAK